MKEGQKVKFTNLAGHTDPDDWGLTKEEMEVMLSHEGQTAVITSADINDSEDDDYNYFSATFEDGFEVNAVSGFHFEPVEEGKVI